MSHSIKYYYEVTVSDTEEIAWSIVDREYNPEQRAKTLEDFSLYIKRIIDEDLSELEASYLDDKEEWEEVPCIFKHICDAIQLVLDKFFRMNWTIDIDPVLIGRSKAATDVLILQRNYFKHSEASECRSLQL